MGGSYLRSLFEGGHCTICLDMVEEPDELVEIDLAGNAHPMGETAALRMQGRRGRLSVLPSPAHMLVMRRLEDESGSDARACVLSGETRYSGTLCDVIGLIGHAGWKGELLVLGRAANRSLYFDQGYVVGAQSTAEGERLGEVLYRYGVLDQEQLSRCSQAMAAGALRFGEAAVRSGFVAREKLFSMAARQVEEIVYAALLESGAVYYFLESYEEAILSLRHRLSVTTLVREGVRRMHETRHFRARIPSSQHIPVRVPNRPPPEADLLQIFPCIDGQRSVAEITRVLGQSEFDVSRALFQFVQSEHVVLEAPRMTVRAVTEVCNQVMALILRELDAIDEGDPVREKLTAFAKTGDTYPELFLDAGAAEDGALDTLKIGENVTRLRGGDDAEQKLAKWLYDFTSYALSLAKPHLDQHQGARGVEAALSRGLSQRVEALLEPMAAAAGGRPGHGLTE